MARKKVEKWAGSYPAKKMLVRLENSDNVWPAISSLQSRRIRGIEEIGNLCFRVIVPISDVCPDPYQAVEEVVKPFGGTVRKEGTVYRNCPP